MEQNTHLSRNVGHRRIVDNKMCAENAHAALLQIVHIFAHSFW
jgi:hypothetical protein